MSRSGLAALAGATVARSAFPQPGPSLDPHSHHGLGMETIS